MEDKPIKRNESIVILSREHHHGLLFGWKLKQGLRRGVDPARMEKYVSYFWNTHLEEHFRDEESLLFNEVQHELIDKAIQQHTAIMALVRRIPKDDKDIPEAYLRLAELVSDHIRFEERELFPYLESVLSPDQLSRIGHELARLHAVPVTDDYPDEFWISKKNPGDAAGG